MHLLPDTKSNEQMVDSLKELFEALNTAAHKQQHCLDCGSLLAYMHSYFWLVEDDHVWSVLVPCCRHCHPELTARTTFVA
jgi:hypothetical protein